LPCRLEFRKRQKSSRHITYISGAVGVGEGAAGARMKAGIDPHLVRAAL
jgi:hypothetical protein